MRCRPSLSPGMETYRKNELLWTKTVGTRLSGTPRHGRFKSPLRISLAAEMENSMGRRKLQPVSPSLPALGMGLAGVSCPGTWGEGEERKGLGAFRCFGFISTKGWGGGVL